MRPRLTGSPVLSSLYDAALHNLLDVNVTATGYVRAGGGYDDPWTRDAAINCWHAASLLTPDVARATLLKVCDLDRGVVAQDNQWWDQIIWVIGAWQHVAVTGDTEFGATAYEIGRASLEILDRTHLDAATGLYAGPALMQDGISGLPSYEERAPYSEGDSSYVLDYPGTAQLRCLSTNAVYVRALRCLSLLGGEPSFARRADALASAINQHLWDASTGLYGYFLGPDGLDPHQETAGLALAIEFGIAGPERTQQILANAHREPFGMVNVWPHFPRYDAAHPGRHNAICWPMVMGLWASAVASTGSPALFGAALNDLTRLFQSSDNQLFELYNATTGAVDGGWQTGHQWESLPHQTWSATAYLRQIHESLFGLHFTPAGITVTPVVPEGLGDLHLTGLPYRAATLDITLTGTGTHPKLLVDGQPATAVPATLTGPHALTIEVS
ncbi:MGH1-like glycoside hydrolase domain-containing protein [Kribbella sp. DT2]|uniref:MGH1-like glycoside hydrolase domain-containing protein n=1 Tax=Kribbella sp. DT2 TaxID=3393427 RepID=UPI003CF50D31